MKMALNLSQVILDFDVKTELTSTYNVIPTSGTTVWTDILLLAISAFTTSLWIILEVEQCMELLPRNLEYKLIS